MRTHLTRIHEAYLLIKDPRATRIAFLIAYLSVLQSGVAALIHPPTSIAAEIGPWLTLVWAISLTVGGLVGAASVLQGWNYVERIGVAALLTGTAIYGVVVLTLHFSSGGQRLTQAGFVAFALSMLIWRLWEIRRYLIEPRG